MPDAAGARGRGAGGLWTILRPDQTAQSRLRAVTGTSLLSPGAGRTSPMPAGSTSADADALAVALRQLATQCPPRPQSATPAAFKQKKWVIQTFGLGDIGGVFDDIGDAAEELGEVIVDTAEDAGEVIVDTAEDAGEVVVDTAEDAGEAIAGAAVDVSNAVVGSAETVVTGAKRTAKSAAGLLEQGEAQVAALRVKANKTAARVGQAAISTLIDSADSLAIFVDETVEAAGGWVEVIGTSIVNGAEVAWRTVVSGVEDALTAVTALLKRIGAEIQQFIDYLAYLFAWGDFLAESDKLYGTLEQSIQGLGGMLQQAGSYKDELGKTLRSTVKKAVGNRTVGDLFGLRIDRSNPAIEHLEYFLEQVQRAIESVEAVFEGVADVATGEVSPSPALLGSAEASAARLPMSSLANPLTLLTTPVKDLLAGNGALADGSSSLLDAAFSEIVSSGGQAITTAVDQVRARIKVPWLTDMIETVILGGRSFTLLRAAALAGAIPSVLTSKLSGGQKKEEASGSITGIVGPSSQPKPTKTPQQKAEAERSRRALWASTGLGLINSAVVVGKTVLEMRKVKQGIGILTVSSGICICMRGYCTSLLLSRYSQEARPFAKTNVWFDVIEGVYTVLRGLRKAESDAKWAKFDMAFHGILGLAITTSSAIALGSGKLGDAQARTGFAFRCTSWVGNSMVRLAEKSDDVMTSPTAKKCTLGLAAIVAVVEIAEAVNGNVDDVQSTE
ncbi:hypothetical protein OV079_27790 [Nannocystis pusilla]|uniref:Uncharacterized protein n=1 Tax=Nannocystis pusilla TaxID=889268 RepID=A0A9X3J0Q6_9BACT|nr:hypothetical protein [Nannocystis pusilla]MCY1009298.1 hypothetical protein [Nannocystis pusilla]